MENFFSTRQVSQMLGIKPENLQKAIWQCRLNPLLKSPSGNYLWTLDDVNRASWKILHKAYEKEGEK